MAAFFGTYTLKVDKKGRCSVPARFRAAIHGSAYQGVMLSPSANDDDGPGMLDGSDYERLQQLIEAIEDPDLYDDEARAGVMETLESVQEFPFDSDGRMVLSQDLRDHAGITDEAIFAGRGSTFQVWSPERYDARKDSGPQRRNLGDTRVPTKKAGA